MKLANFSIFALCSSAAAAPAVVEERQFGIIGGVVGGVTSLLAGTTTSLQLTTPTALPTITTLSTGASAGLSLSVPTAGVSASVSLGLSLSIPTTTLVSATAVVSVPPLFSASFVVSASIGLCIPGAPVLLDTPALQTALSSVTTSLDKATNPVTSSNSLLGSLIALVPTSLTSTQLLTDIATTTTLINVNVLGVLAGVSVGQGCLDASAQLNLCTLLEQLLLSLEYLLTKVQNTCGGQNRSGPLCTALDVGLVLTQLVTLHITIDQLVALLVSLGLIPSCSQRMLDRRNDLRGTIAGTVITLNNLPNVISTNVGAQAVAALGFTGAVNNPLFQSLAGLPNRKREVKEMKETRLSSRRGTMGLVRGRIQTDRDY